MQIRIPSSTPLQVSWWITIPGSISPGFFSPLGTIQRMKCGSVQYRVSIRESTLLYKYVIHIFQNLDSQKMIFDKYDNEHSNCYICYLIVLCRKWKQFDVAFVCLHLFCLLPLNLLLLHRDFDL